MLTDHDFEKLNKMFTIATTMASVVATLSITMMFVMLECPKSKETPEKESKE